MPEHRRNVRTVGHQRTALAEQREEADHRYPILQRETGDFGRLAPGSAATTAGRVPATARDPAGSQRTPDRPDAGRTARAPSLPRRGRRPRSRGTKLRRSSNPTATRVRSGTASLSNWIWLAAHLGQIEERACEVPPGWPRLFGPAADDRIAFEIDADDPDRRRGVRGGSDRVRASREDNVASKCNKFTSQVKKPLDGVPRRSGALVFADPHLVHIFTVVHSSQIARRAAASEVRLVKTTVCQSTAPHPNKNP